MLVKEEVISIFKKKEKNNYSIKDFQLLMKLYLFFLFSLIIISPHSTNNSTNNRLITNHQMTPRQTLP